MTPAAPDYPKTYRTEGHHPRATIHYGAEEIAAVLKIGYVAHIGFPYIPEDRTLAPYTAVVPQLYGFDGETIFLHSSLANWRLYEMALLAREEGRAGAEVCVNVSLVDALVLGPTALEHGLDYRSVVVYGTAVPVLDREGETTNRVHALRTLSEQVIPHRWDDTGPVTMAQLDFTGVLGIKVEEASYKTHPDPSAEAGLKCGASGEQSPKVSAWRGHIPVQERYGPPVRDADVTVPAPDYVEYYHRILP